MDAAYPVFEVHEPSSWADRSTKMKLNGPNNDCPPFLSLRSMGEKLLDVPKSKVTPSHRRLEIRIPCFWSQLKERVVNAPFENDKNRLFINFNSFPPILRFGPQHVITTKMSSNAPNSR